MGSGVIRRGAILFGILLVSPLGAQVEELGDRFDYDGNIFTRAIFLARDLPLPAPPVTSGTRRSEQSYAEYYTCLAFPQYCRSSRNREQQDFYTIRLQLNLAFRPSSYADVLYGAEIGDLTFGREGAGTGRRSTLETRELILKLHNTSNTKTGEVGIFSVSTPSGLVLAASGAGIRARAESETLNSGLEGVYIRSIDNSRIDGDSNGFSDENFSDIHLSVLRWKWTRFRTVRPELYGVYRQDDDPSADDPTDKVRETSRVYWGGLYSIFQAGAIQIKLHAVGNFGRYFRPLSSDPKIQKIITNANDPLRDFTREAIQAPLRERYTVNAGAGEAEFAIQILENVNVAAVYAGASGRLPGDREPDGSVSDYRPDQFRTATSSFQFSELALDDSGGLTVFRNGRLTGVTARGARIKWQLFTGGSLETRLDYYRLDAYRTPTLSFNRFYTNGLKQRRPTAYLGEEWNMRWTYEFFSDLKLTAKLGWFDAGSGYKAYQDVEYGDDAFEAQVSLIQKF